MRLGLAQLLTFPRASAEGLPLQAGGAGPVGWGHCGLRTLWACDPVGCAHLRVQRRGLRGRRGLNHWNQDTHRTLHDFLCVIKTHKTDLGQPFPQLKALQILFSPSSGDPVSGCCSHSRVRKRPACQGHTWPRERSSC